MMVGGPKSYSFQPASSEFFGSKSAEKGPLTTREVYRLDFATAKKRWKDYFPNEVLESFKMSKIEIQRQELIFEIMTTELEYVNDLEILERVFIKPIQELKLLTEQESKRIFLNIQQLSKLHQNLIQELEERKKNSGMMIDRFCDIFLSWIDNLELYTVYTTGQDTSLQLTVKLRETNPKFRWFLTERAKHPLCRGLDFNAFILRPLQRLTKYPLLFSTLLSLTDPESRDFPDCLKLESRVKEIVNSINEDKRLFDNQMTLFAFARVTKGLKDFPLVDSHRRFIMEGTLKKLKVTRKYGKIQSISKSGVQVYALLFNDILLWTRLGNRGGEKQYTLLKPPCQVMIAKALPDHPHIGLQHLFQCTVIHSTFEDFVLQAPSEEIKQTWLNALASVIPENMNATIQKQINHLKSRENVISESCFKPGYSSTSISNTNTVEPNIFRRLFLKNHGKIFSGEKINLPRFLSVRTLASISMRRISVSHWKKNRIVEQLKKKLADYDNQNPSPPSSIMSYASSQGSWPWPESLKSSTSPSMPTTSTIQKNTQSICSSLYSMEAFQPREPSESCIPFRPVSRVTQSGYRKPYSLQNSQMSGNYISQRVNMEEGELRRPVMIPLEMASKAHQKFKQVVCSLKLYHLEKQRQYRLENVVLTSSQSSSPAYPQPHAPPPLPPKARSCRASNSTYLVPSVAPSRKRSSIPPPLPPKASARSQKSKEISLDVMKDLDYRVGLDVGKDFANAALGENLDVSNMFISTHSPHTKEVGGIICHPQPDPETKELEIYKTIERNAVLMNEQLEVTLPKMDLLESLKEEWALFDNASIITDHLS